MPTVLTFILCIVTFFWQSIYANPIYNEAIATVIDTVIVTDAAYSTEFFDSYATASINAAVSTNVVFVTADTTIAIGAATSATATPLTSSAVPTDATVSIATTPDSSDCSLFFDFVDVYYFPTAAANTACLSGLPSVPTASLPYDYTNFQSPSIYVVIPTISAGNSNSQVGNIHTSVTMTFTQGQLSTIELPSRATNLFDLGDLPCPPPSVASADWWLYNPSYNPQRPYRPLLSAPPGIFNIDPAWNDCVTAVNQGIDPPTALPTANELSGPGPGRGPPRKHRRVPTHAHRVPRGPVETSSPL